MPKRVRASLKACGVGLWLAALWLAFAAGGAVAQDAAAVPTTEPSQYVLSVGDEIDVIVFGEEDLSSEHKIDGSGVISLPLIGDVKATGRNLRELERVIADRYRGRFLINPRVTIEVLNFRPFYVLGEVKEPGSYEFHAGMRVMNAIALAGGFTYRADEDELFVIRAADPESRRERATAETLVMPGDTVKVGQRFF